MQKISYLLCPAAIIAASLLTPVSVQACAPLIQDAYVLNKGNAYYPILKKNTALKYFIETSGSMLKDIPVYKDGVETLKAEELDFTAALKKYCPEMPEAEQKKLVAAYLDFCRKFKERKVTAKKDFPVIPAELEEFRLYHLGREELDAPAKKPFSWDKLLSLPPARRHFKTTWVLYLKGNLDKANIHARAAEVRKAVDAGFADTPGFGWGSWKQEMKYGTDPVKVIRATVAAQRNAMDQDMVEFLRYYNPKFTSSENMLSRLNEQEYRQILADPICREFAVIYEQEIKKILTHGIIYKYQCVDILAFRAWNSGHIEEAESFISMQQKPTLLSLYVESEIARYYGHMDLAARKLRQWLKMAEKVTPESNQMLIRRGSQGASSHFTIPEDWKSEIYGVLGYTMVLKRDFMEAARFFYESGQGESDLPYIAERFLSLEQLIEFTESISKDAGIKDKEAVKPYMAKMMKHLTARRAFREGKFDIAKKYMPEKYKGYLDQYLNFLAAGRDEKRDRNERGIALYNAAKILRYKGMELCGTETGPDNFRYNGNYANINIRLSWTCKSCRYDRYLGSWEFCQQHNKFDEWKPGFNAVRNYLTVPAYQRWHYRYLAADLALEAGNIAQDPELLGLINLFGGEIFQLRSPREADIFYKRLVNQSRKTKLGKKADDYRWFPYDIVPLRKEIHRIDPIKSLDDVKQLMKEAFPEKPAIPQK